MQLKHLMILIVVLSFILSCSEPESNSVATITGYIEPVEVYVSAPQSGWIESLAVQEGSQVSPQQHLVRLDNNAQQLALKQAQASFRKNQQQLADLQLGARGEEVQVVQMQLQEQQALLVEAQHELARQNEMRLTNATSEAAVERAQTDYDALRAKKSQLQKQLKVLELPARENLIGAARAQLDMAKQAVDLTLWELDQRWILSRQTGQVEEVFFRQGEFVTQGTPILSVVLPEQYKVRFFVEQARLSELRPGQQIEITNDNGQQCIATIAFIAKQPEFTPPVLYSNASRDKLVFKVEAKTDGGSFRAGQPVDVTL